MSIAGRNTKWLLCAEWTPYDPIFAIKLFYSTYGQGVCLHSKCNAELVCNRELRSVVEKFLFKCACRQTKKTLWSPLINIIMSSIVDKYCPKVSQRYSLRAL